MSTLTESKYKQALVVRVDLAMGKGKIAVQCSHAAVSAAEEAKRTHPEWWKAWWLEGQPKIAVKVRGEESILELQTLSRQTGLPHFVVRDRGLTQIKPGTITCIGVGPAPQPGIDRLTRELPLL